MTSGETSANTRTEAPLCRFLILMDVTPSTLTLIPLTATNLGFRSPFPISSHFFLAKLEAIRVTDPPVSGKVKKMNSPLS